MVNKLQNRKDHSVAIEISNRNQISIFSRKAYDKFVPMLVSELQPFLN